MHRKIIIVLAFLAILVNTRSCRTHRGGKEGWRPFAWYGFSGYQAGGDWTGIVPATTTQDKPQPLKPIQGCSRK